MMQRIEDVQYLGMENKHSLVCTHCGADMPSDPDFQALHMLTAHGMEC